MVNWEAIRYQLTRGWGLHQFEGQGGAAFRNQLYFLNRYGPAAFGLWAAVGADRNAPDYDPNVDKKGFGFQPARGRAFGEDLPQPQAQAIHRYMQWYDEFRKGGGKHDDALRAFMSQNQGGQFKGTKFDFNYRGNQFYKNRYYESYTPVGFNPFETKQYNGAAILAQAGGDLRKAREIQRSQVAGGGGVPPAGAAPAPAGSPSAPAPGAAGGGGNFTDALQAGMQSLPQTFGMALGDPASYMGSGSLPTKVSDLLDDQAYRNLRMTYGSNPQSLADITAYGKDSGAFAWGGAPAGLFTPKTTWIGGTTPAAGLDQHMDNWWLDFFKRHGGGGMPVPEPPKPRAPRRPQPAPLPI